MNAPLYPALLGAAWSALPDAIRDLHEGAGGDGVARVERGRNPLARLAAWIFRLPPAADSVAVTIRFDRQANGTEIWHRRFGDHQMISRQSAARGRAVGHLTERFGAATFTTKVITGADGLRLILTGWRVLGLPLPLWLGPRIRATETASKGRFRFDVEIAHPLTGLIVRYSGQLTPRLEATPS